jgi:hypothetical protein
MCCFEIIVSLLLTRLGEISPNGLSA